MQHTRAGACLELSTEYRMLRAFLPILKEQQLPPHFVPMGQRFQGGGGRVIERKDSTTQVSEHPMYRVMNQSFEIEIYNP